MTALLLIGVILLGGFIVYVLATAPEVRECPKCRREVHPAWSLNNTPVCPLCGGRV